MKITVNHEYEEVIQPNPHNPEAQLWIAVILRAIEDLGTAQSVTPEARREAKAFLFSDYDLSLKTICETIFDEPLSAVRLIRKFATQVLRKKVKLIKKNSLYVRTIPESIDCRKIA